MPVIGSDLNRATTPDVCYSKIPSEYLYDHLIHQRDSRLRIAGRYGDENARFFESAVA
jgi:hypothetical protein